MGKATSQDPDQAATIQPGYPNDPSIPDVYAEGVGILGGFNSYSLIFNRAAGDPLSSTPVAVIRVSPHQAKIMAMLLGKAVRDYETAFGALHIPEQVLRQLGLEQEIDR